MAEALCVVCRARFAADRVGLCPNCGAVICPLCGAHERIILLGTFVVPQTEAASVRASVWGRAN